MPFKPYSWLSNQAVGTSTPAMTHMVIGADEDGKPWAEIEETTERLVQAVGGSMGLVAGARFELATFGL